MSVCISETQTLQILVARDHGGGGGVLLRNLLSTTYNVIWHYAGERKVIINIQHLINIYARGHPYRGAFSTNCIYIKKM